MADLNAPGEVKISHWPKTVGVIQSVVAKIASAIFSGYEQLQRTHTPMCASD